MAISISCGKCGKRYSVKDELAGKKIRCKECETLVAVPTPDDDDPFGGGDIKSSGRAIAEVEDEEMTSPAPRRKSSIRSRKAKSSTNRAKWSARFSGMPTSAMLAIGIWGLFTAVSIGFTLRLLTIVALLLSDGASLSANGYGQLTGDITRTVIEVALMRGLLGRSGSSRNWVRGLACLAGAVLGWFFLYSLYTPLPTDIKIAPGANEAFFAVTAGITGLVISLAVLLSTEASRDWFCE